MTPEREKEIRKYEEGIDTSVTELLAEIDALRAEYNELLADHSTRESYLKIAEKERDQLKAEVERLNRVIAQELSENDELGAEYTYVRAVKAENAQLKAENDDLRNTRAVLRLLRTEEKLAVAVEALEFYSIRKNYDCPCGNKRTCQCGGKAREALATLRGEKC